jgi:hypothetical protein
MDIEKQFNILMLHLYHFSYLNSTYLTTCSPHPEVSLANYGCMECIHLCVKLTTSMSVPLNMAQLAHNHLGGGGVELHTDHARAITGRLVPSTLHNAITSLIYLLNSWAMPSYTDISHIKTNSTSLWNPKQRNKFGNVAIPTEFLRTTSKQKLYEISSSHGGEYEAQNLLGCTAVFLIECRPTFQRYVLPTSSLISLMICNRPESWCMCKVLSYRIFIWFLK